MERCWQEHLDRARSLGAAEQAVLRVLVDSRGKVLNRAELAAKAGLGNLSSRRVDSVLVNVRRAIGQDNLITVRGRGWRVVPDHEGSHP